MQRALHSDCPPSDGMNDCMHNDSTANGLAESNSFVLNTVVRCSRLQSPYTKLKAEMEEHFGEEESNGLRLMRANYTFKEFIPVEKKIIGSLKPTESAAYFHAMTDDDRQEFFKLFGIPGFAQVLFIMPTVKKFDR